MMNKMNRNWLKGMAMALMLVMAVTGTAAPMRVQAASKKVVSRDIAVKIKNFKDSLYLGKKLTITRKKKIQLSVNIDKKMADPYMVYGFSNKDDIDTDIYVRIKGTDTYYKCKTVYENITSRATYKSSRPKVISVDRRGRLTAKSYGSATLTIRYGKLSKKLKVTVEKNHKHNYKPRWKTRAVMAYGEVCNRCKGFAYDLKYHTYNHLIRNEFGSNWWIGYYLINVKYINYYECNCGLKKTGQPKPKSRDRLDAYQKAGYKIFRYPNEDYLFILKDKDLEKDDI